MEDWENVLGWERTSQKRETSVQNTKNPRSNKNEEEDYHKSLAHLSHSHNEWAKERQERTVAHWSKCEHIFQSIPMDANKDEKESVALPGNWFPKPPKPLNPPSSLAICSANLAHWGFIPSELESWIFGFKGAAKKASSDGSTAQKGLVPKVKILAYWGCDVNHQKGKDSSRNSVWYLKRVSGWRNQSGVRHCLERAAPGLLVPMQRKPYHPMRTVAGNADD